MPTTCPFFRWPGPCRAACGLDCVSAWATFRLDVEAGHGLVQFVLDQLVEFAVVGLVSGEVAELRRHAAGVLGPVAARKRLVLLRKRPARSAGPRRSGPGRAGLGGCWCWRGSWLFGSGWCAASAHRPSVILRLVNLSAEVRGDNDSDGSHSGLLGSKWSFSVTFALGFDENELKRARTRTIWTEMRLEIDPL